MKYHHSIIFLAILILTGCSSNSGLTSSFGSRKYTKGVFWDKQEKINATVIVTKQDLPRNVVYNSVAQSIKPIITKAKELPESHKKSMLLTGSLKQLPKPNYTYTKGTILQQPVNPSTPTTTSSSSTKKGTWNDILYVAITIGMLAVSFLLLLHLIPGWWTITILLLFFVLIPLAGTQKQKPTKLDLWLFSRSITSFILSIFGVFYLLAYPLYKVATQPIAPGYILTVKFMFLFSFYDILALTIYLALRALLQKDGKNKGWAIAALAISVILLVLSFALHFV